MVYGLYLALVVPAAVGRAIQHARIEKLLLERVLQHTVMCLADVSYLKKSVTGIEELDTLPLRPLLSRPRVLRLDNR